ncbi:MAG: hypothetical protein Q7T86_09580 [Hyphomicrobiaceae bacterium]|nr:hypothetical protein [Hyphomicrobiaceae bacterium]
MDATDIVLRVLGAFFTFAGYVATRAILTSLLVDRAIAAIGATAPPRGQTSRAIWLLCVSNVVLLGGAALLLGLKLASYLFAASVVLQSVYFFIAAPRYFDRTDAPDAKGRSRSTNAFIIYTLATGFILWAHSRDALADAGEVPVPAIALVSGVLALHTGYVLRSVWQILSPSSPSEPAGPDV